MPLTKISTGLVSDSAITGVKINDASIQAVDLATASVTSDKLHTTLNLASHTVTLPENSISNRELKKPSSSGNTFRSENIVVKNRIIPISAKAINCVNTTEKMMVIFLFFVFVILETYKISETISFRLLTM